MSDSQADSSTGARKHMDISKYESYLNTMKMPSHTHGISSIWDIPMSGQYCESILIEEAHRQANGQRPRHHHSNTSRRGYEATLQKISQQQIIIMEMLIDVLKSLSPKTTQASKGLQ